MPEPITTSALQFEDITTGRSFSVASAVIVAGYTGRDHEAVEVHIAELATHGIPRPDSIPAFYRMPGGMLVSSGAALAVDAPTSGEVEPVLIMDGPDWWVAVGSDHTDRELERADIAASKQSCAKVVSRQVVPYQTVRDRWDHLVLRSWADDRLYQSGSADSLMEPETLLSRARAALGELPDPLVLFMGTVPLLGDNFVYADRFRARLDGWAHDAGLEVDYQIIRRRMDK